MNEADMIKLVTLAYWRYDRHYITGAIECNNADVLTLSRNLLVVETEVKVSIADMRREVKTKQGKHWTMGTLFGNGYKHGYLNSKVHYFYFVVPARLEHKAFDVVKELYPYAGLLVCREGIKSIYGYWGEPANVYSVILAKRLQRPKLEIKEVLRIAYASSNTALRYGNKLVEAAA